MTHLQSGVRGLGQDWVCCSSTCPLPPTSGINLVILGQAGAPTHPRHVILKPSCQQGFRGSLATPVVFQCIYYKRTVSPKDTLPGSPVDMTCERENSSQWPKAPPDLSSLTSSCPTPHAPQPWEAELVSFKQASFTPLSRPFSSSLP